MACKKYVFASSLKLKTYLPGGVSPPTNKIRISTALSLKISKESPFFD